MSLTLVRVKVGPWGGTGGSAWDEGGHDASGGSYTGIRSMAIGSSWCVDSMLFEYDDNGKPVKGSLYGEGNPGAQEELDFPGEFLTHVSGYHDNHLRSLQFRSNRNRTFGPYGAKNINNEDWSPFEVSMEGAGSIVGFSGRSGGSIDAIGVYIAVWSPQRFYDKMQTQGVLAYRTSPLHLQLRALHEVEQQKREEKERQRIQTEVQEQRDSVEKLRAYLDESRRGKSLHMLKLEQRKLAREIQRLEELMAQQQRERQRLMEEIQGQQERLRTLQAVHKGHGQQARLVKIETERLRKLQQDLHYLSVRDAGASAYIAEMKRRYQS